MPARNDRDIGGPSRAVRVLLACAVALSGACGGESATAPDTNPLPLKPGRQLLTLAGFAVSADPALPPCTPAGQPPAGTSVNTIVLLTNQGGEWVARSEAGTGSIELTLRGATSGSNRVTGTMAGSAVDIGLMGVIRDVSVTLGSAPGAPATLDGEATSSSSFVVGRITGALRFSDSQGLSCTCPAIQWSMQPY